MRTHNEAATELAPFVRLLHDTLSDPPPDLPRHDGKCWRWLELPPEVLDQYEVKAAEIDNIFAFAGFTSTCMSAEKTWENFTNFPIAPNTLFVFSQGRGQGPIDISSVSAYPEEVEGL